MNTEVKVNQFVYVNWSEESVPFPALVSEIISDNEFRAIVIGQENHSVGAFRFYNSDLAMKRFNELNGI